MKKLDANMPQGAISSGMVGRKEDRDLKNIEDNKRLDTIRNNQYQIKLSHQKLTDMLREFDRLDDLDFTESLLKMNNDEDELYEKPSEETYVLNDLAQELTAISDNIEKMTISEDEFVADSKYSDVPYILEESESVIQRMIQSKKDEVLKIQELIESFRLLRQEQEFQLSNSIKLIKESSGIKEIEEKLLDRELKIFRIKTECEKKEEIQKLVLTGLDYTEKTLKETFEKFELDAVTRLTTNLKSLERDLVKSNKELIGSEAELNIWRDKLREIMKAQVYIVVNDFIYLADIYLLHKLCMILCYV